MPSVKSVFNPTLFKKNLTRFWPIWSVYGLIWLVSLPLLILNSARYWDYNEAAAHPLNLLCPAGQIIAFLFGVLGAMAVFSYLYNNRSTALMHTLPMKREGLFLTNYLSGLSFFLLPNLAVFLLTLVAEAVAGAVDVFSIFMWLLVQSLMCLFFYSFGVFCAMFTGHILALPAFYGILNFLVLGLTSLFDLLAQEFIFGYDSIDGLYSFAEWFTPVIKLENTLYVLYPDGISSSIRFYGLHLVLLYAFVGLVFTLLALLVYRRRQLECAGDVVSVNWVRPVFKYGVAVCCAISLGLVFYSLFSYSLPQGMGTLLVFLLLWGAAGYFVAEMLLRKSFRVFSQGWKGCGVLLVCLTVAACAMEFDLTGFEGRVPAADTVETVSVYHICTYPYDDANYTYIRLEDAEDLSRLEELHRAIVLAKDEIEANDNSYSVFTRQDGLSVETGTQTSMDLLYTLKNGKTVRRSYYLPITAEALNTEGSYAALLNRLVNTPALVERQYFSSNSEDYRLVDAYINQMDMYGHNTGSSEVYVPTAALPDLLEAVRADIAAGDLGRRYLLEDADRLENCYLNDLNLTFRIPSRQSGQSDSPTTTIVTGNAFAASVEVVAPSSSDEIITTSVTITLQASARRTLAVLEQYGVVTADQLTTHAESYLASMRPAED